MKFKFISHTADIKFQAFGNSLEDCFKNASYALINIMFRVKIKNKEGKKFFVKGKDLESLLYNFLEEFLFLIDSENFILGKIEKIRIIGNEEKGYVLNAEISGDNVKDYKTEGDIKAITYHEMFVKKENTKYVCQVIVDV